MSEGAIPMAKRGRKPGRNITGSRALTRSGRSGPPGHRESVARARKIREMRLRQAQAFKLHCDNFTYEQIAKKLGISDKTAWYDVTAEAMRLRTSPDHDVEVVRARHQADLDALRKTHLPNRRSAASAKVVLDVLAREAKLHGTDKPPAVGYSVDQVRSMLTRWAAAIIRHVADLEVRRQLTLDIRRTIPAEVLAAARDAEPGAETPENPGQAGLEPTNAGGDDGTEGEGGGDAPGGA